MQIRSTSMRQMLLAGIALLLASSVAPAFAHDSTIAVTARVLSRCGSSNDAGAVFPTIRVTCTGNVPVEGNVSGRATEGQRKVSMQRDVVRHDAAPLRIVATVYRPSLGEESGSGRETQVLSLLF